jgi:hypothetical protein
VLHQRVHELRAAEDVYVLAVLLLQPRNPFGDVPFDEGGVFPL